LLPGALFSLQTFPTFFAAGNFIVNADRKSEDKTDDENGTAVSDKVRERITPPWVKKSRASFPPPTLIKAGQSIESVEFERNDDCHDADIGRSWYGSSPDSSLGLL
jgi:hypothetical protein